MVNWYMVGLMTWLAFVAITLNDVNVKVEVFEKSDFDFTKALMVSCTHKDSPNVFCFPYTSDPDVVNVLDIVIWFWNFMIPLPSLLILLIIQLTIYTYVWIRNICMAIFVLFYLITLRPILWLLNTNYIHV